MYTSGKMFHTTRQIKSIHKTWVTCSNTFTSQNCKTVKHLSLSYKIRPTEHSREYSSHYINSAKVSRTGARNGCALSFSLFFFFFFFFHQRIQVSNLFSDFKRSERVAASVRKALYKTRGAQTRVEGRNESGAGADRRSREEGEWRGGARRVNARKGWIQGDPLWILWKLERNSKPRRVSYFFFRVATWVAFRNTHRDREQR